jgi:hypothetical protein
MLSISVTHIIRGKKTIRKNREEISILMGLILEVYLPDKKYPGFTRKEGEIIQIFDRTSGCWLVHCVNSTAVSGISKIEYVESEGSIVHDDKHLGAFKLGTSIISDKDVRRVHQGLQNLVNGFVLFFPETRDLFQFHADEAAHA